MSDSKAVYVDEKERIVYNAKKMSLRKLYHVMWHDEAWALMKTEDNVEFMKFYPHKHNGIIEK